MTGLHNTQDALQRLIEFSKNQAVAFWCYMCPTDITQVTGNQETQRVELPAFWFFDMTGLHETQDALQRLIEFFKNQAVAFSCYM